MTAIAPKPDESTKTSREDREIFFSLKVALWILLASRVADPVARLLSIPLLDSLGVPAGLARGTLGFVVGSLVTTLAVVGWLRVYYKAKRPVSRALGLVRSPPYQLLAAIGLGILGAVVVRQISPVTQHSVLTSEAEVFALALLWIAVLAPVLEEIVFRGVLLSALTHRWGAAVGVPVSTACFAVMHIPDYGLQWDAMGGYLWVGGLGSLFRLRTGSLVPAIGLHMAFNATVSLP